MKRIIHIGNENYRLTFDDFDDDINIDNLLSIDYSNLIGEIVTFPLIVNRFGILLADAESKVQEAKLNLEVFEAKTKESLRVSLSESNGGKNPTVDNLNNALTANAAYQAFRKKLIEKQKIRDYINSVYWASKDKSQKLDKLSLTIQQGDVSDKIIEGKINHIVIKKQNSLIDRKSVV